VGGIPQIEAHTGWSRLSLFFFFFSFFTGKTQKHPKKFKKSQNHAKNLPLQEDFCYKHTASAASSFLPSFNPAIRSPRRYLRQVAWARHPMDWSPHWIKRTWYFSFVFWFFFVGSAATSSFILPSLSPTIIHHRDATLGK
jgi:hypothetical protein